MATTTAVRNQVLEELGVIKPGQTVGADDAIPVDTRYSQWHALYSEKNAVYWGSLDDIPEEAVNAVVDILVDECAHKYKHMVNMDAQRRIEVAARRIRADKDLRLLNHIDYQPSVTPFEDF